MYLVRKRALGDILWIEPVIRALASRHKKVIVYTLHNDLFRHYPLPNVTFRSSLHFFEKILIRVERFIGTRFFSIDLNGSYEKDPHRHFLEAYENSAGVPVTREYPRLYLDKAEKNYDPGVKGPYVVLHLESFTDKNYRKVYGVDWAKVVRHLHESGYAVLQIGKQPEPIPGAIIRSTSLREMMALLAKASFFIGLDSGPSHIAAALGTPAILFFGAVNPAYRHFSELMKGFILQQPCPYAGCFHNATHPESMVCRLVGNEGIPICSLHTTDGVLDTIDRLRKEFVC